MEDAKLKEQLIHILDVQLADTMKAQILLPNGSYEKVDRRGKEAITAQEVFCQEAVEAAWDKEESSNSRVFIPEMHIQED